MRLREQAWRVAAVLVFVSSVAGAAGQTGTPKPPAPQPAAPAEPADALGRSTPKGTVVGFLNAARRGESELARQYLDTRLGENAADTLAHQLFVVLDARLPARLTQISDEPQGSRADPAVPDREHVGTIETGDGPVKVFVERVQRRNAAPIWLFTEATLDRVPALYDEVIAERQDALLPDFLQSAKFRGVRVAEWLAVLLGFPALYFAAVLLNRIVVPVAGFVWRLTTRKPAPFAGGRLPIPVRLLILAVAGRWAISGMPLSLVVRQFGNNVTSLMAIVSVVWLLILLNGKVEAYIHRHSPDSNQAAAASLLRILRRVVDMLFILGGLLATLRYYGVDSTPALAGLGLGGIAVALAAQKTLENVIAGASLIFDQAVRVGDFLKMGETQGTVDYIGLRSTRIRTLDRTVVSVPNGQIANASLETLSARDKFWFHPTVGLRYETTPEQLRKVVDDIRRLLEQHPAVDPASVRVRFIRLGPFSLDIDVFAYLFAADWNRFLEIQEQLLFRVTGIVRDAGAEIAFPSQTMYLSAGQPSPDSGAPMPLGGMSRR